jgi:dipeptidyl aminopeptidase/acylaminoacyl peptidase
MRRTAFLAFIVTLLCCFAPAQEAAPARGSAAPAAPPDTATQLRQLQQGLRSEGFRADETQKEVDDLMWHIRLQDVADVDKISITASKPIRMANSTGQGAGNPLIIYGYTFIPKKLARGSKAPMIVLIHGGVHASFDTSFAYVHIVRELLDQGYIVVAPDYRGSTGYGREYYDQIDYGGAEIDDTHDIRNWAVENLPQVDATRVGIMGWSHGGYHTLLNILRWPGDYKVAYAGCPVSDLVMRMGYKSQGYRDIYAGFIGKQAEDNPMEYRKRSPYFYADKLGTPLLVHSNTNDEDVNVMEVEHFIDSVKASGKGSFMEYKIYKDAPGGHHFNRLDTALARESRKEVYAFLAKYLKP